MISLCTVCPDNMNGYLSILTDSILTRSKNISEILVARIDADPEFEKKSIVNGMPIYEFGLPIVKTHSFLRGDSKWGSWDHAIGLHECIERSSRDYLMFCDPDIFFYTAVDVMFMELKNKHNFDYIGISHTVSPLQASTYFVSAVCSLIKKSILPDKDFLKGHLKFRHVLLKATDLTEEDTYYNGVPTCSADGLYLLPGPLPAFADKFPNKDPQFQPCNYDVGCNLWLWAEQNNWKWLSFQTTDCHLYTTAYHRSNVKMALKLKKKKLIWHAVGGSLNRPDLEEELKNKYEESKEDDEE